MATIEKSGLLKYKDKAGDVYVLNSSDKPFIVTVTESDARHKADKTFAEIKAAFDAKRICLAQFNELCLHLVRANSDVINFTTLIGNDAVTITMLSDFSPFVETSNIIYQSASDISGLLKGDGGGNIEAAIEGTDYVTPESMNAAIEAAKVTVDTTMSSTSTNPVQNKVVAAAIDSAIQSAIQNTWEASY